jgi:hypothetical protein
MKKIVVIKTKESREPLLQLKDYLTKQQLVLHSQKFQENSNINKNK